MQNVPPKLHFTTQGSGPNPLAARPNPYATFHIVEGEVDEGGVEGEVVVEILLHEREWRFNIDRKASPEVDYVAGFLRRLLKRTLGVEVAEPGGACMRQLRANRGKQGHPIGLLPCRHFWTHQISRGG